MRLGTLFERATGALPVILLGGMPALAAEPQAEAGLPQLNPATYPSQVFWAAVLFAVLYFLLSRVALPRVGEAIEDRSRRIGEDLDKAAQMQQEAEAALADYEKTLSEARTEAQSILRAANEEIARTTAEAQQALGAELAAQTREAESRIAAARREALDQVRSIAVEVARSAAARLAGREVDPARVEAAVQAVSQEGR